MDLATGRTLAKELHPRHPPLLVANTPEALVGLAQMSVCSYIRGMQWHPISSILIGVIFDLDPDAVLPWTMMTEAAMLLKVVLDEMGLSSFPKTSGGRASMLSCR